MRSLAANLSKVFVAIILVYGASAKALNVKGTVFEEACRGMEIDEAGPELNDDFVEIVRQSSSKQDFYRRISEDKVFAKLSSNFIVQSQTASLDSQNATKDYPRVIGFGGKLILASTDHPSPKEEKQANVVEGIAYASKTKSREFFRIKFSSGGAELELPAKGCYRCHFGRYNWETYNTWPGAEPSKGNYLTVTKREPYSKVEVKQRIAAILEQGGMLSDGLRMNVLDRGLKDLLPKLYSGTQSKDPTVIELYKFLVSSGLRFDPIKKIWTGPRERQRKLEGIYATLDFKGLGADNRELNEMINALTFDQLAHDLKQLDSYPTRKFAALASVMDCGRATEFLSSEENVRLGGDTQLTKLIQEVGAQLNLQYEEKAKVLADLGILHYINQSDIADIRRMANLRYLFELEGFRLGTYSPNFFGRKDGLSYGFAHVGAGSFGVNQLMCFVAPELVLETPELQPYFSDGKVIDSYRNHNEGKEVCQKLKDLSTQL